MINKIYDLHLVFFSTHAKLADTEIRHIARNGNLEAMITQSASTYVVRYSDSEWSSFSSTGWTNTTFDAKNTSGSWITNTCNGHFNNRGFSTWSDSGGSSCSTGGGSCCGVVYSGSPTYMTTWHTSEYSGGCCSGAFSVYVR